MNRNADNTEETTMSTVTLPVAINNKKKSIAELEKALYLLNRRCDWQSKRIAELTNQNETMKTESAKMASELCLSKRLLSTNFDVQEFVNKLFKDGDESDLGGKNHIVVEKSPCGAVSVKITATKEMEKLRKMAQLSEMRVSDTEALVHHLQRFVKELVTDSGDCLHDMSTDNVNEYLKQKGWETELEAQCVEQVYDDFSWFLRHKKDNPVVEVNDEEGDLSRSKKRRRGITVYGI